MNEAEPKPLAKRYLEEIWPVNLAQTFGELAVKHNVTNPFDLPAETKNVRRAFIVYDSWMSYTDKEAAKIGTPIALEEANFKKTIFLADAGYSDPSYIADVVDWLQQDEERTRSAGLIELADKIQSKITQLTDSLE